jgi:2-hydroxymuconate-semialdehyde hydrolase
MKAYAERDFTLDGHQVGFLEGGTGFPVLMIHGSGPGASTIGNWRLVLDPLAEHFHIYAMDLIGFGRSGRKASPPYFDLELWLRQCRSMIDLMGADRLGVIGHSLSGMLALRLAATDARVAKVLTTGSMGARFLVNEQTVRTWTFPRNREEIRKMAEGLVYDKSRIDDAYLDNREKILFTGNYGIYFETMFAGEKQRYVDATVLSSENLARVTCDVVLMHGRDDIGFPPEISLQLAHFLPHADIILLGRCSHSIAMEHPSKLVTTAGQLFRENTDIVDDRILP